jgi:transglutaminase-like putative cysteine protease
MRSKTKAKPLVIPPIPVSREALGWLLAGFLLTVSRHVENVPLWAVIGAFLIAGWRLYLEIRNIPLPSRWVRLMVTGAVCVSIALSYRSFWGRDPGITALILLVSLKLLELKTDRDFNLVIFLCYFLILGVFLYDQTIPILLFTILAVIFLTAAVLRIQLPPNEKPRIWHFVKRSAKAILFALPFVAVLFLFFPRTSGPLLNIPQRGRLPGYSGFSGFIRPGFVAYIARSEKLAFRVEFPDSNPPLHKDRYFRGAVLWYTDGVYWFQGKFPDRRYSRREVRGPTIRQKIMLEPHSQRWLFALDRPVITPERAYNLPGNIFRSRKPIKTHHRYEVVSQLGPEPAEVLSPVVRKWSLQKPRRLNPRLIELARSFRESATEDRQVAQAVLDYFRDNGFVYSVNPGYLDRRDPLTDFLFDKRKGFCEHYSGAFTMLMRIAGIPARVVVGYHGGEYNPVGDYLLVRQSDAHAWSEVWIEGEGWLRVDPTSVVAPERIEYGMGLTGQLEGLEGMDGESRDEAIRRALNRGFWYKLLLNIRYYWDTVDNHWNLWIISYDLETQQNIMSDAGLGKLGWFVYILIIGAFVVLVGFFINHRLKRRSGETDPLMRWYGFFCRKCAAAGLTIHLWEGPLDFKNRLELKFHHRRPDWEPIIDTFIALRYGRRKVDKKNTAQFKRMVKKFHL